MANEFLNTYIDSLRDRYLRHKQDAEQAAKKLNLGREGDHRDLMFEVWCVLHAFHNIVLRRTRFKSQATYATKVLIDLDEKMYDRVQEFSRKRKWKTQIDMFKAAEKPDSHSSGEENKI